MLNILEIETLGGHIGGNQDVLGAHPELADGLAAFLLVFAAVGRDCQDALEQEVLVDRVNILK